jgi:hypothetical protein
LRASESIPPVPQVGSSIVRTVLGLVSNSSSCMNSRFTMRLDDLARREVITRRFVGLFVEAPDQVFEQQAHLDVVYGAGVQINFAEFA